MNVLEKAIAETSLQWLGRELKRGSPNLRGQPCSRLRRITQKLQSREADSEAWHYAERQLDLTLSAKSDEDISMSEDLWATPPHVPIFKTWFLQDAVSQRHAAMSLDYRGNLPEIQPPSSDF